MKHALRALAAKPGFTIVAVLTLAIGFGVNAAIFSMTRTILLRPLPYRDVDRLALVGEASPSRGLWYAGVVPANYIEWRQRVTAFEATAAWRVVYFALSGETDRPMRVQGVLTEPAFFSILGVTPSIGRPFTSDDGRPGGDGVVILSHGFWSRQFGADPRIVGRSLNVDGTACTIIGVLPESFKFFHVLNRELDVWRPFVLAPTDREHSISLYAKLKNGVSLEAARAELVTAYGALPKEGFRDGWTASIEDLSTRFSANQRPILAALEVAVALVLCIAAANVATLMVARAAERRRESAVRVALGATWWQLVRELGREALLVSAAGAVAGVLLATWTVDILNRSVSYQDINRLEAFRVDLWVVGFTFALAIGCASLFTLLPSRRIVEADVVDALNDSAYGSTAGVTHRRLRGALVVAELALSIVLLTSGLQLARHAFALNMMNRGVDAERVMTAQLSLNAPSYDDTTRLTQFAERVVRRMTAAPGVAVASLVNYAPLSFVATSFPIEIDGRPQKPGSEPLALCWIVAPRYFETVGIPTLAGRDFGAADTNDRLGVAIASRSLARRFWGRMDVVGERLRVLFPQSDAFWIPRAIPRALTIVGVVGDVREDGVGPSQRENDPQLYLPYAQNPTRIMTLVVRAAGPPETTVPLIRDAVRTVDPDQPTFDERTLDDVRAETFARARELAWLIGAFAALALLLSAIGVYGVMASLTAARRREMAIRLALGASRGDVISLVVGAALRLAAVAVVVGMAATPVAMKLAAARIAGLDGWHPGTMVAIAALLAVVSACAATVPAYRTASVGELVALRE